MVSRDGAQIRKERIQEITKRVLSYLCKKDGEVPLSKTLAFLEYDIGLRREKFVEYLNIGSDVGRFVIDKENDKIKMINEN
jgi:hypothetical protein